MLNPCLLSLLRLKLHGLAFVYIEKSVVLHLPEGPELRTHFLQDREEKKKAQDSNPHPKEFCSACVCSTAELQPLQPGLKNIVLVGIMHFSPSPSWPRDYNELDELQSVSSERATASHTTFWTSKEIRKEEKMSLRPLVEAVVIILVIGSGIGLSDSKFPDWLIDRIELPAIVSQDARFLVSSKPR